MLIGSFYIIERSSHEEESFQAALLIGDPKKEIGNSTHSQSLTFHFLPSVCIRSEITNFLRRIASDMYNYAR